MKNALLTWSGLSLLLLFPVTANAQDAALADAMTQDAGENLDSAVLNDAAVNDLANQDSAVVDSAVDDSAVDDSAVDDSGAVDVGVFDVPRPDSALADGAPCVQTCVSKQELHLCSAEGSLVVLSCPSGSLCLVDSCVIQDVDEGEITGCSCAGASAKTNSGSLFMLALGLVWGWRRRTGRR